MSQLRNPSARPSLVVDERSRSVADANAPPQRVGVAGPLGRERVVFALPLQWVELKRAEVVVDSRARLWADPVPLVIAPPDGDRVIVHRMVWAGKAEDTRRL